MKIGAVTILFYFFFLVIQVFLYQKLNQTGVCITEEAKRFRDLYKKKIIYKIKVEDLSYI